MPKHLAASYSVVRVPEPILRRALAPALDAICRCGRQGDRLNAVATIRPEDGTVTTRVSDEPDVDACLQSLERGHFERFELGSDCIECGARKLPPASSMTRHTETPEPPPPPSGVMVYPFVVEWP